MKTFDGFSKQSNENFKTLFEQKQEYLPVLIYDKPTPFGFFSLS
jgi:hypothetical protein